MFQANPHGIVADVEDGLQFLEGGVGMLADMGQELGRIELAPGTPTGLGRKGAGFGGGQIAIDAALPQLKKTGGFRPRPTSSHKLHHPLA